MIEFYNEDCFNCCGRGWIDCELDKEVFEKANAWIHNHDKQFASEYIKMRIH